MVGQALETQEPISILNAPTLALASLPEPAQLYWRLLLHEAPHRPGTSEIDSSDFFLSPNGKTNFQDELAQTVRFLSEPPDFRMGKLPQHPQCLFPERTRFLTEKLNLKLPKVSCPEFIEWKSRFHPNALTLVYAAPFLGSPASMFGHTFLKMRSKNSAAPLSYALSFEAAAGESPGIVYALYGLIGLYPGIFNVLPYHMKLQVYTSMESRDLWEYELPATPEGIDRMLNHLWELGPQFADYFFFDENCSYHLLALLEIASSPPKKIRNAFRLMAIPSDTLAAAVKAFGNSQISLRPSLSNTLTFRLNQMNQEDRKSFFQLLTNPLSASESTPPQVLDAVLDGLRMKRTSKTDQISYASDPNENHLLALRAAMPTIPQPAQVITAPPWPPSSSPPHLGHRSSKLGVAYGLETDAASQTQFTDLKFRPAFHDEIDPSEGHLPFSSLNIARTTLRIHWQDKPKIFLQELTLAEVKSFGPPDILSKPIVWQIWGGYRQPLDLSCRDCGVGHFQGGWGLSQNFGLPFWNWMMLLNGTLEVGNSLAAAARIAPSLKAIGLLDLPNLRLALSSEAFWFYDTNGNIEQIWNHEIKTSFLQKRDWDIRAVYAGATFLRGERHQVTMEAHWYF